MSAHRPTYNGAGRLSWVTCSCRWQSGAFHRSTDADHAFALHASRQVSVSADPSLAEILRTVVALP
jgi:hypothetical protein